MGAIAGIKFEKDAHGVRRYVRIDMNKYGSALEDFFDNIACEEREDEERFDFNDVVKSLTQKKDIK